MSHYKEEFEYRKFTGPAEMQKAINSFRGILDGISIDHDIVSLEVQELTHWYHLYRGLIDRHPFSEILPAVDTALADQTLTYEEVEDLRWLCRQVSSGNYYNLITCEIQTLHGLIHGLLADNTISDIEISALQVWLNDHADLSGTYPFDEIFSLLYSITEDGVVSDHERNALKAFFSEFVDARDSLSLNELELAKLRKEYKIQGICAKDPVITLPGHTFCFTGKSSKQMSRNEIARIITDHGGIFENTVTNRTQYLIVGVDGSPCWSFSCYGRKVEAAMSMRKKGHPITIINENDFWPIFSYEQTSIFPVDTPKRRAPTEAVVSACEDDDFDCLNCENPERDEIAFLDSIRPMLLEAIEAQGGEHGFLSCNSSSSSSGYSAVFIGTFTAFRLHLRGKSHYISVPAVFTDLIPGEFPRKQLKSDSKYARLLIDKQHPIESYTDFLVKITGETINRYPKEWSCCSRYMECSDAKICIHPDKAFALACGYRKILNSRRIFYGKNRNI